MQPGPIQEFKDWKEIARLVYANSKKNITMYRSVVSFSEETAKELLLYDQKSWQRYIENHILGHFDSGEESICAAGDSGGDTQADDKRHICR